MSLLVWQGLRYGLASLKRKIIRRHYSGNAQEICAQIVHDCWNGVYFQNSLGNYREFWMRDFGMAVDSLLRRGYKNEVVSTLRYALDTFKDKGVHTAITRQGFCFSFPNRYSPDSVMWLFYALAACRNRSLTKEYAPFLNEASNLFAKKVVDGDTVSKQYFGGMRDYAIRKQSCYDCAVVGMLQQALRKLPLENPLKHWKAKKAIMQYWTGTHFKAELHGSDHVTGDANLFPFFLDLPKKIKKSAFVMMENELATPLPLQYTTVHEEKMSPLEFFVPGWERNKAWSHMGLIYLQKIKKVLPEAYQKHRTMYTKVIERHGTLFELYNGTQPYKSLWYYADDGMLWAANF